MGEELQVSLRSGVSAEYERTGEDEPSASEAGPVVESLDGEGSMIGLCGAWILSGLAEATDMADGASGRDFGSGVREREMDFSDSEGEEERGGLEKQKVSEIGRAHV